MHNRICRVIKTIINTVAVAKEKNSDILFIMHLIRIKVIPFNRIIHAVTTNGLIPLDNDYIRTTQELQAEMKLLYNFINCGINMTRGKH